MNPMHILDGFLDASPSLWMLRTLCLIAALLTGCWCLTRSLEHRIQAQLQGSRIELGEQLQDLERKITAILDELRRARAALSTCGPASVDNELSRSSDPRRKAVQALRRTVSDGDLDPIRASKQRDQQAASTGDPLIEPRRRQSATEETTGKSDVAAMGNGGARRASVRCGERLTATEGAGPMLSMHVVSRGSNKKLSPAGTSRPIACQQRHLDQRGLQQPDRRTDLASAITDYREPDVFKRKLHTTPSGRSTKDSASSSIQRPGSPGQRWRPLVLHEQSWQNMRPEIIARTCSQPSSGRAPDDNLGFGGNRILLTPPTDAFAIFALSTLAPKVKTTKSVDSPPNTPPVQVTCRGLLTCGDSSYHGTLYPKGITRSRSTDDGMLTSSESSLLDLQW